MQWDRTADPAELSGTVRGLGVTDAILLELQAVQRPLLEQQLRAMAKRSASGSISWGTPSGSPIPATSSSSSA
jgi:hypothetical protein